MKPKHTPTPYYLTEIEGEFHIQSAKINEDNYVCQVYDKPTAQFIVKAVNSHNQLVEALKEAQSYILKNKGFKITNTNDFHIANVMTSALKNAESEA